MTTQSLASTCTCVSLRKEASKKKEEEEEEATTTTRCRQTEERSIAARMIRAIRRQKRKRTMRYILLGERVAEVYTYIHGCREDTRV